MRLLFTDLHSGYRALRRAPAISLLAILILALGIGATTSIFSVVYTVLLRPLPFPQSRRLAMVFESFPRMGFPDVPYSAPDYIYLRDHARDFAALAVYRGGNAELSGRGQPERLPITRASANLPEALQTHAQLGRWFTPAEDAGGQPVAVLSYGFWQRKFGGRANVLGQAVELSRKAYTIVGVMPPQFEFPLRGGQYNSTPAALWIPISFSRKELTGYANMFNNSVLGRLRAGVSRRQARAEVNRLLLDNSRQYYPAQFQHNPMFQVAGSVQPLRQALTGQVRPLLWLLLGAVGLVLAIGCADVSSLLLTRAAARQPEMAMRAALGASRGQLLRQLLTEALVLALAGGASGVLLAWGGVQLLTPAVAPILPAGRQVALEPAILIFALAISVCSTLVFGLAPAWQVSGAPLVETLKQGRRGGGMSRRRHRLLAALIVGQFALAAVLLVSAGLLLRSFRQLLATSPGFQPQHLESVAVSLPRRSYAQGPQIRAFYRQLLSRAAALPGVRQAALTTVLPLHSVEHDLVRFHNKRTGGSSPVADVAVIEGDYFSALRIPVLRGRGFSPADRAGAMPVAIVNQALARQFWPHQNPIGRRIRIMMNHPGWQTVVGVAGNVKNRTLSRPSAPQVYLPYEQVADQALTSPLTDEFRALHLVVRAQTNHPAALHAELRGAVAALDSSLPVFDVESLPGMVWRSTRRRQFALALFGIFSALALVLAIIGIYGVISFSVAQRTPEFGVRMALGAQPDALLRLVLTQGLRLAAAGIGIGALLALAVGRLLGSLLYGISAADPLTYAAVVLLLAAVGMLAAGWPAWRASRLDATTALRYE